MEYKGHPVEEAHPNSNENAERMRERMREFHEQRGHGAVRIHVKLPDREVRGLTNDYVEEPPSRSELKQLELDKGLPNGVWTIEGPRGHRTFRIVTVLPSERKDLSPDDRLAGYEGGGATFREKHAGKRVLQLLIGPDNMHSYKGLAWYSVSGIGKLWKFGTTSEVLVNTFAKLVERAEMLDGYTVHFAKHCLKCNRLLTTPESIERGVGPVCANGGWDV